MSDLSTVFAEDASTVRTLRNIRKTLRNNLEKKYNYTLDELKDIEEIILETHGLDKNSFDFVSKVQDFIKGHLNDNSIDDNSNKNEKTIQGIINESSTSVSKAVGYDFIYREMVILYGKREAKRLSGLLYDYSLAISDSTKILQIYCWAFDASKIVLEGRPFGQLTSKPPKTIHSYTGALCETIHQMSNHLAGAIAISTFFFDYAHILLFREGKRLKDLKDDNKYRKYIQNCMQSFVHSVNHLSRSGVESPFTNISVFDDVKLRSFMEEMDYYFNPEFYGCNFDTEEVLNTIKELQDIYLNFIDKGDPSKEGTPYRFPVNSINISKDKSGHIFDQKFLDYIISKDIYRYNIFVSEGSKVASCCRLLSDMEMLNFASQSNSFGGGGGLSLGSHRVVTINFNRIALEVNNIEEYFDLLEERIVDTVKILKAHKELIKGLSENKLQQFVSLGWINLKRLFSTIGLMGLTEATLTLNVEDRDQFTEDVLSYINKRAAELGKEFSLIINIEQIPGESMSHRLAKIDKLLFGEDKIKYPLYANQFIPLWEDVSIWERIEKDGKFNQLITGGGIVHFSLGEKTTKSQNKKIIDYAVAKGCEHFALNPVYSICKQNHSTFGNIDICPKCGNNITSKITRTVGFFTPVEDWTEKKRLYDFNKRNYQAI